MIPMPTRTSRAIAPRPRRQMAAAALAVVAGMLGWSSAGFAAADTSPGNLPAPLVEIRLIADAMAVAPGSTVTVALEQTITPGWHTYWKNPGDSGQPTTIAWDLPPGFSAGPIQWPLPEAIPYPPLRNFGYSDKVRLPVTISVPVDARPDSMVTLTASASWLVCEKVCIPEDGKASVTLRLAAAPAPAAPGDMAAIREARAAIPQPAPWAGRFAVENGVLRLALAAPELKPERLDELFFFPDADGWIDHAGEQTLTATAEGIVLAMPAGYAAAERLGKSPPTSLTGVLAVTERVEGKALRRGFQLTALPGAITASADGHAAAPSSAVAESSGPAAPSLILALLMALAGGVILNLMPCVFPILSMKALALAKKGGGDLRAARSGGLAYGTGVILSFLALATLLIALKAGGAAVGWGFQLQSPPVVAAFALVLFAVGLSLSGVFTLGGSVMRLGAGLAQQHGHAGAFFTGVLAVVVAAPCTAPFMATALGYALTQPAAVALLVFFALGVGFAAPYLALSYSPALIRRLPRPGAWMDTLKQALAFPMYASAAWLAWVLTRQAGADALLALLLALVMAGFAGWAYGGVHASEGSARRLRLIATAVGVAAGIVLIAGIGAVTPVAGSPAGTTAQGAAGQGPRYETFSPARLAALQAEGRPVFVNLTAAWCITCLVNERVALSSAAVAEAFAARDVAYLKGDWTLRDPAITKVLEEFGRSGVPLYLLYPPPGSGRAPMVLPQLLTEAIVTEALAGAL